MRRALVSSIVLAWGCGGGQAKPVEPAPATSRCVADDKLAATRVVKPAEAGCSDQAAWDALAAACDGKDPAACYQLAVCTKLRDLSGPRGTPEYTASLERTRGHLRVACDGGIAEACTFRVGAVMLDGAPLPADGCADLVRGCGLGDADSCAQCTLSCEGQAAVAPAPTAQPDECCCPLASAEGVDYNVSPRADCEAAGTGCIDDARCAS